MEHYPDHGGWTPEEPKAVISSSPLKMASSAASMNPSHALQSSMSVYIHKYCEVATGGRVSFQGWHHFAGAPTGGWYRFKCKTCQDNWNMKADLFSGNSCPKELQDWLDQHKHVCDKFKTNWAAGHANPVCSGCGWAWNQHKAAQPVFDIAAGVWQTPAGPQGPTGHPGPSGQTIKHQMLTGETVTIDIKTSTMNFVGRSTGVRPCVVCEETIAVASGSSVCDECYKAAKTARSTKTLTQPMTHGRMFRTMKPEEDACESPKTLDPMNSFDSANSTTSVLKD